MKIKVKMKKFLLSLLKMKTDTPISRRHLIACLGLSAAGFLSSCASKGVQERQSGITDTLGKVDKNMRIRRAARDERFKRGYDRLME